MIDTQFLSALVLALGAIGGVIAWRKIGAERASIVVGYQGNIIEDLHEDNERLHRENARIKRENEQLRVRVRSLELRLETVEKLVGGKE